MVHTAALDNAPTASAASRRVVERLGGQVDEETMADLRLLVSEIVTNAVEHVGGDAAIGLSVGLVDGVVRVEVRDAGTGFRVRRRSPGDPMGSGWGLHFVEVLADRWGAEGGDGTVVWFEMPARMSPRPTGA